MSENSKVNTAVGEDTQAVNNDKGVAESGDDKNIIIDKSIKDDNTSNDANEDKEDNDFLDDFEELTFSDYIDANQKTITAIHKDFLKTIYSRTEERETNLMNRVIELECENKFIKRKLQNYENIKESDDKLMQELKKKNEELVKQFNQLSSSISTIKTQISAKDAKLEILKKYQSNVNIELLPYDMMLLIEKLGSYRKETDDVVSRLKIINELSSNIALKNIVTKMIDTYTSSSSYSSRRNNSYY